MLLSPFGEDEAAMLLGLTPHRDWTEKSVRLLEGEALRSADTHLLSPVFPRLHGISIYLKDESTHPTGSLKHRLARSLFLYGICNGKILEGTTLVEASSGSTAVSEAYFANLLGLPFIAVMPRATSKEKICAIERFGGNCHFVDKSDEIYDVAASLAQKHNGHYLDQFTYAERATDWRGNNNIAESIFAQMRGESLSPPKWVVMGAGTGGTASTIGRYIRYRGFSSGLCVVDVEHSAFFNAYVTGDRAVRHGTGSRIEGVGRPRVEPSFIPEVIDCMLKVPDAASIAATRVLSEHLSRKVGGSTGTNFFGLCWIASQMIKDGERGSLVSLICDSGERYADTIFNDSWLEEQGIDIAPYYGAIRSFLNGEDVDLTLVAGQMSRSLSR
jgi:cysteine synthase